METAAELNCFSLFFGKSVDMVLVIIIVIIRNLESAIMPLGGYRGTKWLTVPDA